LSAFEQVDFHQTSSVGIHKTKNYATAT